MSLRTSDYSVRRDRGLQLNKAFLQLHERQSSLALFFRFHRVCQSRDKACRMFREKLHSHQDSGPPPRCLQFNLFGSALSTPLTTEKLSRTLALLHVHFPSLEASMYKIIAPRATSRSMLRPFTRRAFQPITPVVVARSRGYATEAGMLHIICLLCKLQLLTHYSRGERSSHHWRRCCWICRCYQSWARRIEGMSNY